MSDYTYCSTESLFDYDWFKTVITNYLPLLRRFHFYLYIDHDQQIIEENFQNIHNHQYHSQLIIDDIRAS